MRKSAATRTSGSKTWRTSGAYLWAMGRPTHPPVRIVTLMMWLLLVATPIGAVWGFWQVWSGREVDKCEQRVATRDDTRGIWFDVIGYLHDTGADPAFVTGLTARITDAYPQITVAECLAGTA